MSAARGRQHYTILYCVTALLILLILLRREPRPPQPLPQRRELCAASRVVGAGPPTTSHSGGTPAGTVRSPSAPETREAHYHVGEVHPNLVYPLDFLPKLTQRMSDNMSRLQQTVGEPWSDEEKQKRMMNYGYSEHVMEAPAAAATPQGQPEPPQPQPTAERGLTAKSESTTVSIARK